jgi:hypothetical protein
MFCNKCGHKLSFGDAFCSKCGNDVKSITSAASSLDQGAQQDADDAQLEVGNMDVEFTSKLLLGGNVIRPDRLIINHQNVIYEKRNKYLIGVDRVMIPISRIASVEIDRRLISSKIIIYSKGNQSITVENFSVGDAKKIKEEIERRM